MARKLFDWPALHRAALVMGPSGFVAVIAGWVTTEVGRQPYTVYGLLTTAESASPLAAPAVAASLVAFVIVYFAVFGIGTWYILKLMAKPPHSRRSRRAEAEQAPIRSAGHHAGTGPGGGRAMSIDLTTIWAFIIAFAVFMYVVMDGFDLGIGILFPSFRPGEERSQAMNAIAPVWDGNETWLVLGGGGLMAAFPLAYAIILPATYPLIIAMLLGLVFRGVAFEYRWRDPSHERFWDFAFFAGSLVAALSQGMILGALLQGVTVDGRAYAGGWLDWLSPYSLLTGAGVVVGYALLGSCYLAMKLTGEAEEHAYRLAMRARRWRRWSLHGRRQPRDAVPGKPILGSLVHHAEPAVRGPGAAADRPSPSSPCSGASAKRRRYRPFLIALALFALGMAGLGVSMWPYVVPDSVTIWEAAAPERSQIFMLVGVALIMPMILAYTGWSYWVFRGKVGDGGVSLMEIAVEAIGAAPGLVCC